MYCVILAICLKRFSFKMLTKALKDTLASAGMSMCLCATGLVFNWVIVTSGLIGFMTTLLMSLGNKIIILLILNAMLLFLGCFIGSMQILIMVAPLLMNLATALGMSCSDGCYGRTECNTWINHSADGTSVVCNSEGDR